MELHPLDTSDWRYTTGKTKTPHIVPLAAQALAILRDLNADGNRRYVFPCERGGGRPMSDNAILAAMRAWESPRGDERARLPRHRANAS